MAKCLLLEEKFFFYFTFNLLKAHNIYNNYSLQDFLCDQRVDLNT